MEKNKSIYILLAVSVVLLSLGRLYAPLLLFVGLAPLLAILTTNHQLKFKGFDFFVLIGLVVSHLVWALAIGEHLITATVYGFLGWMSTVLFLFTNKHSRNKLGLLTLVIFWLGLEYLALKVNPGFAYTLLGSSITNVDLTSWSGYSGITGISCWILISNILLYIVFFKGGGILEGKVRWITLFYSSILIALPFIIPSFIDFTQVHISSQVVYDLYADNPVTLAPYGQNGEVFGRTAAWVSVLIIIYAFVRRQVK